ncbi:MAG: DUF5911 domain-containing protein [Firmicutes bacterium]|nr:DUF5911 domain-containing protein [Bacillota bacterium]
MHFYGFLSNRLTSALVGPDTSVDWLPYPRFDSPSVLTRLLGDHRHGYFRFDWDGDPAVEQSYVAGSNVLETRIGARREITITDFLDPARPTLCRAVETRQEISFSLSLAFQYGLIPARIRRHRDRLRFSNPLGEGSLDLAVYDARGHRLPPAAQVKSGAAVWPLRPGRYLVELGSIEERAVLSEKVKEAVHHWRRLVPSSYRGPHREAFERSLLVLYGLTYSPTRAVIAAPTTSLPEELGGTRQWDYRFTWVRDAAYVAEAWLMAGVTEAARDLLHFLLSLVGPEPEPFAAPLVRIDGSWHQQERELPWLPGYQGSRPCREGNGAASQLQLDIEGDLIWAVARYLELSQDLAFVSRHWPQIRRIVDFVAAHWQRRDASLWEFRNREAHYTHSKLMCWVALSKGAELAESLGHREHGARWAHTAQAVREAIERHGVDPQRGHYVQQFGGRGVDAALLLFPLYGYCPVDAPRFQATLRAIERELVDRGWVYRYRQDMLGAAQHPFVLANTWLARIYWRQGEVAKAEAALAPVLAAQTDLGLLGEHVDIQTGTPRGNFPQAFSHLGILQVLAEMAETSAMVSVGR